MSSSKLLEMGPVIAVLCQILLVHLYAASADWSLKERLLPLLQKRKSHGEKKLVREAGPIMAHG